MVRDFAVKTYQSLLDTLPDSIAVTLMYLRAFGRLPNLKHPKTFNEKIAWRKLHQHDPQFTLYADKIAVKAEIAKLIGVQHVIETLWVGKNPQDIPWDSLQPPYVIKVSHSCGRHVFVRKTQDIKRDETVAIMRQQLALSHGRRTREWGYSGIPHRVLVERMIQMPDGDFPDDYRFLTYHGHVLFIQLDRGQPGARRRIVYDREWNLLPVRFMRLALLTAVPKPMNLAEMISLAEKIGASFDFVRVDLYSPPQGVFFGETTFYPSAGLQPFIPEEWDEKFGEPWQL